MKHLIIILCMVAYWNQSFSQSADIRSKLFNLDRAGLAIQGYDPVSYFTHGKAVEGKQGITMVYEGITYRFSSPQNKEAFKSDPKKYEPQYGGWCAYAMGVSGEKVEVDPETFKIINGKLYLFYNKYFNNTLRSWDKDESRLHPRADNNWSKIVSVTK